LTRRVVLLSSLAALLATVGGLVWVNWPIDRLPRDTRADRVVVEKAGRRLTIFRAGVPLKTYRVALGRVPVGPKTREGDRRTPEGAYHIDSRLAKSAFHRALHVSYPQSTDVEAASRDGVAPGGAIMVHGIRNGLGWVGRAHTWANWTSGCIAVTNPEIEELWNAARRHANHNPALRA
jgi:murein L,D-transpeptidase YafK